MAIETLLSPEEISRVEAKIAAVERLTSAEIRVVLTESSWMGIGNKGARIFRKYGLDRTAERNAVLILVDVRNRELLIYGDQGINQLVADDFWQETRDLMIADLRAGHLARALIDGVHAVGHALVTLFPIGDRDRNEIPDALVFER